MRWIHVKKQISAQSSSNTHTHAGIQLLPSIHLHFPQIHVDGKNNRQMKFQSNERMKLAKLKTLLYRLPFSLLNQCALSHFILAFVSKLSSKYLNVESNIFESTFSAMLPFNRTRCRSQFSLSVSSVFAVRIRGTTHENDLRSDTNAIKIKSRARIVAREIDKQAQRHTHTHKHWVTLRV